MMFKPTFAKAPQVSASPLKLASKMPTQVSKAAKKPNAPQSLQITGKCKSCGH